MALDHSLTYKVTSLVNTLHKGRLNKILGILDSLNLTSELSFCDFGCSNGYLTNLITQRYEFQRATGRDHDEENIEIARKTYQHIAFSPIDLNSVVGESPESFDLVTCFGSLEHAIHHLLRSVKQKGNILISVPIEIGIWGIIKFLVKRAKGYSLNELGENVSALHYFSYLIRHRNISVFRKPKSGWGTHFGFDYREIDRILAELNVSFEAKNHLSTRFYVIEGDSLPAEYPLHG